MKLILTSLIFIVMINSNFLNAQIKIGLFADCQYCDCETAGNRYYRNSLTKLSNCIDHFNKVNNLEFVVGLGDLIDRDFESFNAVNAILERSTNKIYQISGNHDYSVEKGLYGQVPEKLGLSKTYYVKDVKDWKFIFLDGNEITFLSNDPEVVKKAEKMVFKLLAENKPNHHKWNGGISTEQLEWLRNQLIKASVKKQKVIIFCHYPLRPHEAHTLWNSEEVLKILKDFGNVKAWINGHNHNGNYAIQDGMHFITLKGMVDTESENAFCILTLGNDRIKIDGFGREPDRNLQLR